MARHERYSISNYRKLDSLFNINFALIAKKNYIFAFTMAIMTCVFTLSWASYSETFQCLFIMTSPWIFRIGVLVSPCSSSSGLPPQYCVFRRSNRASSDLVPTVMFVWALMYDVQPNTTTMWQLWNVFLFSFFFVKQPTYFDRVLVNFIGTKEHQNIIFSSIDVVRIVACDKFLFKASLKQFFIMTRTHTYVMNKFWVLY